MKSLPLYAPERRVAVELEEPLDMDEPGLGKRCTRCTLHKRARNVCLGADGEPGGLLIVGEAPGRNEDSLGRPFVGRSGEVLRKLVDKHWEGPVAYDNAVRCFPGKAGKLDKPIRECRGYLAQTLHEVQPTRIITLGASAARSVLGRAVAPFSNRKSFAHLAATYGRHTGARWHEGGPHRAELGDYATFHPVPVFMCIHPTAALRNRFVRQWWSEDMVHALTSPDPPAPRYSAKFRLVQSEADALWAVRYLRGKEVAFDVETTGVQWGRDYRIFAAAFCVIGDSEPIVWPEEALADQRALRPMLEYLADPACKKGGQNVKYDIQAFMCAHGCKPRGITFDTKLMRKLLDPEADAALDKMAELIGHGGCKSEMHEARVHAAEVVQKGLRAIAKMDRAKEWDRAQDSADGKLAAAVLKEMGLPLRRPKLTTKDKEWLTAFEDFEDEHPELMEFAKAHSKEKAKWDFGLVSKEVSYRYNARDAFTTAELAAKFKGELVERSEIGETYRTLVNKAGEAAAQVEAWGVACDRDSVETFDRYLEMSEIEAKGKLDGHAPGVNWDSPLQVQDILFNKLRLDIVKTTDSGAPSTDAAVLKILAEKHELPKALLAYRKVGKLRGTYAKGLLPHIRPDGRIHGSLNVDGARTGRTSFSDPNLQNIPRATSKEGKMARDCFVAPEGYLLVQADYSQLELRVAAMLSRDPVMISIFEEGIDYHLKTAMMVADIAWKNVSPEDIKREYEATGKCEYRTQAKSINFGVIYGLGDAALAAQMGCSIQQARKVKEAIMGKLHVLDSWCQSCLAEARKTGGVWTWWDGKRARRRPLIKVASNDDKERSVAEHGSWNTPVQGTASDFCIASLVEAVDWVIEDAVPAKVVLPVHDSIMIETRADALEEVVQGLREIMLQWNSDGVPIEVDVEVGDAWGSLKPYADVA
jgi:uracil-DNA glycosylase family 4